MVLSEYEQLRERRMAQNHAKMVELGLEQARLACRPLQEVRVVRVRPAASSSPARRSLRIAQLSPSSSEMVVAEERSAKRLRRVLGASRRSSVLSLLTAEQRESLGETVDVVDFERFLKAQGTSAANIRAVLKRVGQLVAGQGVRYGKWPDGIVFKENEAVRLSDDLYQLRQEAQKYEDDYGKDLGNGWLLRHPITKLMLYQASLVPRNDDRRDNDQDGDGDSINSINDKEEEEEDAAPLLPEEEQKHPSPQHSDAAANDDKENDSPSHT